MAEIPYLNALYYGSHLEIAQQIKILEGFWPGARKHEDAVTLTPDTLGSIDDLLKTMGKDRSYVLRSHEIAIAEDGEREHLIFDQIFYAGARNILSNSKEFNTDPIQLEDYKALFSKYSLKFENEVILRMMDKPKCKFYSMLSSAQMETASVNKSEDVLSLLQDMHKVASDRKFRPLYREMHETKMQILINLGQALADYATENETIMGMEYSPVHSKYADEGYIRKFKASYIPKMDNLLNMAQDSLVGLRSIVYQK